MEIGGYLEFERYNGEEYHSNCLKLNTARNCLSYLIEAKGIKKIWISRWNCSAVFDTCRFHDVELCYFDLNDRFEPILPDSYTSGDFIYVVNYYGQLESYHIENMIMDNVQAFFQKPMNGVDTIYTCRKYFGVSDGAYLYTDKKLSRELEQDESFSRIEYLAGRLETTGESFYVRYQHNEELLDRLPLRRMSKFSENILRSIDYSRIIRIREENFEYLHDQLKDINELDLVRPIGPFAYPLRLRDGDKIRSYLQKNKIYIAKLWPNVKESIEQRLADEILPLPCDQRYSIEQMRIMVNMIKNA